MGPGRDMQEDEVKEFMTTQRTQAIATNANLKSQKAVATCNGVLETFSGHKLTSRRIICKKRLNGMEGKILGGAALRGTAWLVLSRLAK